MLEAALRTAADTLGLDSPIEYESVRGIERGIKVATIEGKQRKVAIPFSCLRRFVMILITCTHTYQRGGISSRCEFDRVGN